MDDKDFFFLDRPAVPATQQNLIDPAALVEHAVVVYGSEVHPNEVFFATEIKDSNGVVVGTVLYTTSTFASILDSSVIEGDEVHEDEEDDELSDTADTQ